MYYTRYIPIWRGVSWGSTYYHATPVDGVISGTVEEVGSGIVAKVRLYYRLNGALIREVISAADGTFSFDGLDKTDTGGYYVLAIDPEGGTQYNIIVFDRVTPV